MSMPDSGRPAPEGGAPEPTEDWAFRAAHGAAMRAGLTDIPLDALRRIVDAAVGAAVTESVESARPGSEPPEEQLAADPSGAATLAAPEQMADAIRHAWGGLFGIGMTLELSLEIAERMLARLATPHNGGTR